MCFCYHKPIHPLSFTWELNSYTIYEKHMKHIEYISYILPPFISFYFISQPQTVYPEHASKMYCMFCNMVFWKNAIKITDSMIWWLIKMIEMILMTVSKVQSYVTLGKKRKIEKHFSFKCFSLNGKLRGWHYINEIKTVNVYMASNQEN